MAARGQTMSIAFYPQMGMVLFGSEAAATKVAMGNAMGGQLIDDDDMVNMQDEGGSVHDATHLDETSFSRKAKTSFKKFSISRSRKSRKSVAEDRPESHRRSFSDSFNLKRKTGSFRGSKAPYQAPQLQAAVPKLKTAEDSADAPHAATADHFVDLPSVIDIANEREKKGVNNFADNLSHLSGGNKRLGKVTKKGKNPSVYHNAEGDSEAKMGAAARWVLTAEDIEHRNSSEDGSGHGRNGYVSDDSGHGRNAYVSDDSGHGRNTYVSGKSQSSRAGLSSIAAISGTQKKSLLNEKIKPKSVRKVVGSTIRTTLENTGTYEYEDMLKQSFRLDLDDVNGEVVHLRWGKVREDLPGIEYGETSGIFNHAGSLFTTAKLMNYGDDEQLVATSCIDGVSTTQDMRRRLVQLDGSSLIPEPPPPVDKDPVGNDILSIPRVLSNIVSDWDSCSHSLNRLSAWTFTRLLKDRMKRHDQGIHDGSIDLLISGCEVSLWLGEQFHSDLHRIYPKLKIVTISANKLLGELGQSFPIPQVNFPFHSGSYDLRQTPCLLISHSGGTFATLACSNLLKSFTTHIFCVTSEWDTQVANSIRKGVGGKKRGIDIQSYIFITHVGLRPAEPCTVSVVATHQVKQRGAVSSARMILTPAKVPCISLSQLSWLQMSITCFNNTAGSHAAAALLHVLDQAL